jgi:hypothetical protein
VSLSKISISKRKEVEAMERKEHLAIIKIAIRERE